MKQRLYIFLLFVIFYSCKKDLQTIQQPPAYLQQIKNALKDSLNATDLNNLVIEKAVLSKIDSLDLLLLRIPFRNKNFRNDFLLLKTNEDGLILKGKIVQLSDNDATGNNMDRTLNFNGSISLSSMNRKTVLHSNIRNGYIEAFHQQEKTLRTLSMADPYQTLPEVIIVSSITTSGVSYSTWVSLLALMDGGGTNNYYGDISYDWDAYSGGGGGGGYSGGSSDGSGDGYIQTSPLSIVDVETQDTDPAIDINKFLKCFSAVPDAGAICSIEILTDIAVDNDPSVFLDWQTRSPGHVFLKLNKKNGSQSVQQVFGWYPTPGYKLLLNASPIDGKFVNNAYHEYNASLKMDISPSQLQTAIIEVLYLSGFIRYDIDEYNCTDFAIDVFNKAVSPYDRLEIPKYTIPGSNSAFGSSTPNGLYQQLQSIKSSGSNNSDKIEIPGVKGWVGISNGPCN